MASDPVEYVLTRDYVDNNRVNLQHYQWIRLFGYHIHPSAFSEREGMRIADVGTGTGFVSNGPFAAGFTDPTGFSIWLLDLSESLPASTQLDGFDVSADSLPPQGLLPQNFTFRHWDVKSEVPRDLLNVYDIVHIRLFAFVLQDHEVAQVLGNLLKFLKPGGYLHWEEPDMESYRMDKLNPDCKTTSMEAMVSLFFIQDDRLRPHWVTKLPKIFEDGRLERVAADVKDAPAYMNFAIFENNLNMFTLVASKSGKPEFKAKIDGLLPDALKEIKTGVYCSYTRWSVVGRKPSS